MKKSTIMILVLLTLLIAFGVSLFLQQQVVEEPVTEQILPTIPEEPAKRPIVRYAVPEVAPPEPVPVAPEETVTAKPEPPATNELDLPTTLPAIQQSDSSVNQALTNLLGGRAFTDLLIIDSFIQRTVLTINNLPEKKLPLAHVPFVFPEGKFIVSGEKGSLRTNAENHKRYAPYVALLQNINPNLLIRTYVYFYPLIQNAYVQLGYPNAYFNDRLVYVIEHLLETPNPVDPIALEQPSVLYTYADPTLEELSAGQKILLRMGQEQRLQVLSILRNYHFRLTRLTP